MKWLNKIIKLAFSRHMQQVLQDMQQPDAVQQKIFDQLIRSSSGTEFGKKYDFASIRSVSEFQRRVPLHSYEDLKKDIQRMMRGESNILCPGKVRHFSRSSGTTNEKSKYIPVPDVNLKDCHLKGAHDAVAMWLHNNPESKIFDAGRAIIMGGEIGVYDQLANTLMGDVSAIMVQHLPFYANWFLTPDIPTALIPDWEEKIEKIARVAMKQNITNLSGVPTWTLVLFRRILELSGKSNLSEVFPNFEVYLHGGVNFEPYRSQFEDLFPAGKVEFRNTYNASEGFFATQFAKEDEGMQLLSGNGVFYEFVEMDQLSEKFPKSCTIGEVQKNTNYAVVISSNAGLWRYLIGDTVEFTSTYPHQIQITGRTQQYINVFGEEVMVSNTEKALVNTCRQLQAQICEYTVAPVFLTSDNKGCHEWLVEFEKEPQNLEQFKQLLDRNLQQINSDYEAKRFKSIALKELELKSLPKGSFYNWLRQKGKFGGQNKVPRLSNERQYLEEILASLV